VAILQALLSYLARSASTVLNAIFGWAVVALFGQRPKSEQTLLSVVVGAAAVWPILLLGIGFPKIALFVVAFIPLARSVPAFWLRIVWIALAVIVPLAVGIAVAKYGSKERMPEPFWKRLLRGFPITLALAASFLLMMVVAPVVKLVTIARRREVVRVPALMDRKITGETMAALAEELQKHGISLRRAEPPWHMTAPSRIMLKLCGAAFASMASERVEFRRNDQLDLAVLPNETVLRGQPHAVARAHALCAEVYGPRPITQSFAPEARELEARIKRLWSIYRENPAAHEGSRVLRGRLDDIAAELAAVNLAWDQWQTVYRLALQLDRALRGDRPLLEKPDIGENEMAEDKKLELPGPRNMTRLPGDERVAVPLSVEAMSNRELVKHVVESATLLAKKEVELAKVELRRDLKSELAMAKGLTVAGLCAIWTVALMLVAGALALGTVIAEWGAALIVAAAVLAVGTVAGLLGWGKRVKSPLESTRRSLKEDALWAKERLA